MEQINLIKESILYKTGWSVIGRSVNHSTIYEDKSCPFVTLLGYLDEYYLIMFHDETGYYNIEENFPDVAIEIFSDYSKKLNCEIELHPFKSYKNEGEENGKRRIRE